MPEVEGIVDGVRPTAAQDPRSAASLVLAACLELHEANGDWNEAALDEDLPPTDEKYVRAEGRLYAATEAYQDVLHVVAELCGLVLAGKLVPVAEEAVVCSDSSQTSAATTNSPGGS